MLFHLRFVCNDILCTNLYPVREYVKGLKNADELLDMISAAVDDQESKVAKGDMLYPEVWQLCDQGLCTVHKPHVLFHVSDICGEM